MWGQDEEDDYEDEEDDRKEDQIKKMTIVQYMACRAILNV